MDLLFRLKQGIDGFENIEKTKEFFSHTLPERDKSHFFDSVKRGEKLQKGDAIYFAYDSYIVAIGIYTGELLIDRERDETYVYGHALENIQVINSDNRLNNKIFGTRTTYIDNESKKQEINQVLNMNTTIYPDEIIDDNQNLTEGAKRQVMVNAFERNQKARQQCIEKYGYKCSICKFDFEKTYGEIGKNFIHVHHLKPLSEIKEQYEINPIEDLRPVCPNCHAMLHKKSPAYRIEEVQDFINK